MTRTSAVAAGAAAVSMGAKKTGEVNALLRGLAVMRSLCKAESSLGNGDIAALTNLPKSTVSRITSTLTAHGYLQVDSPRRRYRPGPAALLLGYGHLANWNVVQIARPYLKPLANYSRGVVAVGAPLDNSMVFVQCERGPADISFSVDVGLQVPIDLSAMGWAYMYSLDAPVRDELLQRMRQHRGSSWPKIRKAIDQGFSEIERRGFCIAAGFWKSDISAVGVPLRIPGRGLHLGIICGAPRSMISTDDLVKDLGPRLVDAAARIARLTKEL